MTYLRELMIRPFKSRLENKMIYFNVARNKVLLILLINARYQTVEKSTVVLDIDSSTIAAKEQEINSWA